MSSEPRRQPAPKPSPRRSRPAEVSGQWPPGLDAVPERETEADWAPGYDRDDPATWPGARPELAAPDAPGDGESTVEVPELTDAKAMRALAHPVRMSLIDLFGYHATLTATQAGELLGESPANCAFHLRTLAKYGFLREAGGGRGRERPWALVNRAVRITTRQADPQAALAAGELGRIMLDRWISRSRQTFGSPNQVPGWDEATGWSRADVFMTADEVVAAREEMSRVLRRYEDRSANPALRPAGAHPVEWTTFSAPIAEWVADEQDPVVGLEGGAES